MEYQSFQYIYQQRNQETCYKQIKMSTSPNRKQSFKAKLNLLQMQDTNSWEKDDLACIKSYKRLYRYDPTSCRLSYSLRQRSKTQKRDRHSLRRTLKTTTQQQKQMPNHVSQKIKQSLLIPIVSLDSLFNQNQNKNQQKMKEKMEIKCQSNNKNNKVSCFQRKVKMILNKKQQLINLIKKERKTYWITTCKRVPMQNQKLQGHFIRVLSTHRNLIQPTQNM